MKSFFLFLAITFSGICSFAQVNTQRNSIEKILSKQKAILKDTVEVKTKNQTYMYIKEDQVVVNSRSKGFVMDIADSKKSSLVSQCPDLKNIYKSIFSQERIAELKGEMLAIRCVFDAKSNIKEILFIVRFAPKVTLEELNKLETALLNYKFNFTGMTEANKHYSIAFMCDFKKIIE